MPNNKLTTQEQINSSSNHTEDNWANSPAAQALQRIQANPRVKYVVVIAPADACPTCQNLTGTYPKESAPRLPVDECSHPLGCRAFYLPYLDEIYP